MPEEMTSASFHTSARATPVGRPTASMLEKISEHVLDPSILDDREVFVWQATVSNNRVDSYGTRMDVSSLRNFERDALDGISFLDSHYTREQAIGRSFDAKFVNGNGDGGKRVDEWFYTLEGLDRGAGLSTDSFIELVRSGISRDVSIGFYGGWIRCSLCKTNMFRYDRESGTYCPHLPGMLYQKTDKAGEPTGEDEMAIGEVMEARQAEASAVFDGATPGAMIAKARDLADAGLIRPEMAPILEARYRINLPGLDRNYRGVDLGAKGESTVTEQEHEAAAAAAAAAEETQVELQAEESAEDLDDVRSQLEAARVEIARLKPLADDGAQYRAGLIADAMAEGVRAYGDGFRSETYQGILDKSDIAQIRQMRDDWKSLGDERFSAGRKTVENEKAVVDKAESAVPASAFKARV